MSDDDTDLLDSMRVPDQRLPPEVAAGIPRALKAGLILAGLTIDQLAGEYGLTKSALASWASGRRAPRANNLRLLITALKAHGVDLSMNNAGSIWLERWADQQK